MILIRWLKFCAALSLRSRLFAHSECRYLSGEPPGYAAPMCNRSLRCWTTDTRKAHCSQCAIRVPRLALPGLSTPSQAPPCQSTPRSVGVSTGRQTLSNPLPAENSALALRSRALPCPALPVRATPFPANPCHALPPKNHSHLVISNFPNTPRKVPKPIAMPPSESRFLISCSLISLFG